MRRGFRSSDLLVVREPQLLNDKKPDFVVSYGLSGKIIIEVKLSANDEVKIKKSGGYYKKCEEYKEKILNYPKGFGTENGIFLIANIEDSTDFSQQIRKLKELYKDTKIKVIGIDCIEN